MQVDLASRSYRTSVRQRVMSSLAALIVLGGGLAGLSGQQVPRLRTPDERFANLKGYPFAPHYLEIDGLRMHYLDEGSGKAGTMLLLHGEPTWSFLYRHLIPAFTAAGYRIIAPDMIGFGRSDKVTVDSWYTRWPGDVSLRRTSRAPHSTSCPAPAISCRRSGRPWPS